MFSNKDLKKLLLPLIAEQILMSLMGTADAMMVSNVGASALSAVSLVDAINTLVLYLFSAMATGGAVVVSQYIGHRENGRANQACRQLLLSVAAVALFLTALLFLAKRPLLRLIFGSVSDEVMKDSLTYFSLTVFGYPFIALQYGSAALFRASGDSRVPMLVTVAANLLNIAGNAVLIFGLHMGVAGAAAATLVSRVLGGIAMLALQRRAGSVIAFTGYLSVRPDLSIIRRILAIGIPAGVENGMFQLGKLLIQSTVSTLGTRAMAVQAITAQIELFTSMPGMAVGIGLITVVGQCIGAGRVEEAVRNCRKLTFVSFLSVTVLSGLSVLACPLITGLAGLSAGNAAEVYRLVVLIACVKPVLWALAFTPAYGMRAAGDVRYSMIVTTAAMWVLRVGLCWYLCRHAGFGVTGVWIAMFSDWMCRAVLFVLRFRGRKWLLHDVIGP